MAALVIYLLGTGLFSFQWSGALLHHGLRTLAINLPPPTERWLNINLRLAAHAAEYFVLFFVLVVCSRLSATGALGVTLLAAIADEIHQFFVPSRTCSPTDLELDLAGALAAYLLYSLWRRWRRIQRRQQPLARRAR
ncbi:MAG TPA: VanZ family protein [Candidatus Binataceae bacterium]|nr:VanZ family protein [Candidatus Binataceae bacterium]